MARTYQGQTIQPPKIMEIVETTNHPVNPAKSGGSIDDFTKSGMGAPDYYQNPLARLEG